ncbi:MAG: hydrogenase maturation protease [Gemmatimonadota bacterium]
MAIVGLGNDLGGDDGIGPRTARALAERSDLPDGVRAVDGGTLGIDVLSLVEPGESVVLIDAVRAGAVPGTIHRIPLDRVPEPSAPALSAHDLGVAYLLFAARALGRPLRGVVLGVEPEKIGPFAGGISDAVAAVLPALQEAALREARRLQEED